MAFTGLPFEALDFYEDLEADNSKAFWTQNKHRYDEHVKVPLTALAAELEREFGTGKLFRPYRDVRFAKDKTPYKTHQGVYFSETRRYLQVSAAGLRVSGGIYEMASDQVDRYRRAVHEELPAAALETALAAAATAKLGVDGQQLTRIPSGYDRDHPRADLLRYKSLYLNRDLGFPDWLPTARTKTEVAKSWRAMQPLIGWLDKHVGPSDLPVARKGQA